MDSLVKDEILRRHDDGSVSGWQLDHDYLAVAILEEERLSNREAVLLRDKTEAWDGLTGASWAKRYRALLPVRTQIALVWARLRPRSTFTYGSYRHFAALSLLRPAPFMILAGAALGWVLWVNSNTYQVERMIALAPQIRVSLGDSGAPAWADALALYGRPDEALRLACNAAQANVKASMLVNVATRLAQRGDTTRAATTLREVINAAGSSPENTRMSVYGEITQGAERVAEAGGRQDALNILELIGEKSLASVPEGNNRVYVALTVGRGLKEIGRLDKARDILLSIRPQIEEDDYNLAGLPCRAYSTAPSAAPAVRHGTPTKPTRRWAYFPSYWRTNSTLVRRVVRGDTLQIFPAVDLYTTIRPKKPESRRLMASRNIRLSSRHPNTLSVQPLSGIMTY
jgi:hypothetical protein